MTKIWLEAWIKEIYKHLLLLNCTIEMFLGISLFLKKHKPLMGESYVFSKKNKIKVNWTKKRPRKVDKDRNLKFIVWHMFYFKIRWAYCKLMRVTRVSKYETIFNIHMFWELFKALSYKCRLFKSFKILCKLHHNLSWTGKLNVHVFVFWCCIHQHKQIHM